LGFVIVKFFNKALLFGIQLCFYLQAGTAPNLANSLDRDIPVHGGITYHYTTDQWAY